jgi:hypothetical protein
MIPADLMQSLSSNKVQLITGLVVVVVVFVLLRAMSRLLRFALVLGVGAALGLGAAYGLARLGVGDKAVWWIGVGITLVVLFLGMRRGK